MSINVPGLELGQGNYGLLANMIAQNMAAARAQPNTFQTAMDSMGQSMYGLGNLQTAATNRQKTQAELAAARRQQAIQDQIMAAGGARGTLMQNEAAGLNPTLSGQLYQNDRADADLAAKLAWQQKNLGSTSQNLANVDFNTARAVNGDVTGLLSQQGQLGQNIQQQKYAQLVQNAITALSRNTDLTAATAGNADAYSALVGKAVMDSITDPAEKQGFANFWSQQALGGGSGASTAQSQFLSSQAPAIKNFVDVQQPGLAAAQVDATNMNTQADFAMEQQKEQRLADQFSQELGVKVTAAQVAAAKNQLEQAKLMMQMLGTSESVTQDPTNKDTKVTKKSPNMNAQQAKIIRQLLGL